MAIAFRKPAKGPGVAPRGGPPEPSLVSRAYIFAGLASTYLQSLCIRATIPPPHQQGAFEMPLRAPTSGRGATAGGYRGGRIIAAVRQEMADLERLFGRPIFGRGGWINVGHPARFPVGSRGLSVQQPGYVISEVATVYPGIEKVEVSEQVTRQDQTQTQEELLVANETLYARTREQEAKLRALYPNNPVVYAPFPTATTSTQQVITNDPVVTSTPPIAPTSTGGSMDLGSIITDLGKAYITTKYAPAPTVTSPTVQPVYSLPEMAGDVVDYFTGPSGEIVPVRAKRKCRRRRRRLATKSDLGDLAALKAILGNGEAFKAWIATHSR